MRRCLLARKPSIRLTFGQRSPTSWSVSAEINAVHTLAPRQQRRPTTLNAKDGEPMTMYYVSNVDCFGFADRSRTLYLYLRPALEAGVHCAISAAQPRQWTVTGRR